MAVPNSKAFDRVVFYFGAFRLPDRNASALRVRAISKLFVASGFRVIVVGVSDIVSRRPRHICLERESKEGVALWEIAFPAGFLGLLLRGISPIKIDSFLPGRALRRGDIVIYYNYPAVPQLIASIYLRIRGIAVLCDCTEWYDTPPPTSLRNILHAGDIWLRMHCTYLAANGIITVSKLLARKFGRFREVCMIPTTVPGTEGRSPERRRSLQSGSMLVLAGGFGAEGQFWNDSMWKDRVDWAVRLFDAVVTDVPQLNLEIVGVTRERLIEISPALTPVLDTHLGLIRFSPAIPNTAAVAMVREASCTIVLRSLTRRIQAGFPTKITESLSYGTPVITNLTQCHSWLGEMPGVYSVDLTDEGNPIAIEEIRELLLLTKEQSANLRRSTARAMEGRLKVYLRELNTFVQKVATH